MMIVKMLMIIIIKNYGEKKHLERNMSIHVLKNENAFSSLYNI